MGLFNRRNKKLEGIDGGNGTSFHEDRVGEILATIFGQENDILPSDNRDVYKSGRKVSMERESRRTLGMQEALDGQVEFENVFPEDPELVTRRGLPPCKRVGTEFEG